jgi:putative transposase
MARNGERGIDWMGLPMIAVVARLLCRELTLENEYLRLENRILKEKAQANGRLRFTDEERRSLTEAALAMGRSLMKEVVSVVKPETILAWQRRLERQKWDYSARRSPQPGRPRTRGEIEAVVCRLARENAWGYQRIRGELLKLGIQRSKGCIAAILRRNGLPPSPQRSGLTWRQFLARHAEVLLCTDLFTKEVWTCTGLRTAYVLFALHLRTRRVVLAEATFSPHGPWMRQMGRNLLMACEDLGVAPRLVIHDRDELLVHDLDVTLQGAGLRIVKTPFRAPDANAHAERWVRSATGECLDHLILIGLGSLRRTLACYRDFSNHHRPHQGIGNQIPDRLATGGLPVLPAALTAQRLAVAREKFLGGLLNSYYCKSA